MEGLPEASAPAYDDPAVRITDDADGLETTDRFGEDRQWRRGGGGVGKMDGRRRGNMLMIKVCHYCIGWRDAFDKSLATLMDRKQRQPEN